MAVAASEVAASVTAVRAERRLAWLLRLYAALFATAGVVFVLRPDGTVADIDRLGALLGLPTMPPSSIAVASDFWLAQAVANCAALAACSWLAAADVRSRRALAYPVVISNLVSATLGLLLFVRWTPALPFLAITLVDLTLAVVLLRALRRARVA
jgi:hypothetical protein